MKNNNGNGNNVNEKKQQFNGSGNSNYNGKKRDLSNVTCFTCGQKGHKKWNCPAAKEEGKPDANTSIKDLVNVLLVMNIKVLKLIWMMMIKNLKIIYVVLMQMFKVVLK